MNRFYRLLLIGCLPFLVNCKANHEAYKTEKNFNEAKMIDWFNSFNPKWRAAVLNNDPSYIISRYDEDAIIGPPDQPFIRGKTAITKYWQNLAVFLDDFGYETQKLGGNPDDILFENGIAFTTYTIDNQQFRDTTKYLFVWKHVGNREYKVLSEMFNSKKAKKRE